MLKSLRKRGYKIRFDFTDFDDTLLECENHNSSRSNKGTTVRVYDPPDPESEESGRYFKTITINQSKSGQIKGLITEDVTVGTGTVKIFMKNIRIGEKERWRQAR